MSEEDGKKKSSPKTKPSKSKELHQKNAPLGPPPQVQLALFHVERQVEHDGVEMGVLENGIPYLTESGLARMCGIDRKVLNRMASNWGEEKTKPRGSQILELLDKFGYTEDGLFLKSELNGSEINAYTEPVCLAVLEYYAFIADEKRNEAINAYRSLARISFRAFIYGAVGYSPERNRIDAWKHFHDRIDMTLDAVPVGYFSIFREIASMIVPMIRAGIVISDKVVPDISVGMAWSKFWKDNDYDEEYGKRVRYNHAYPEYYPQSKSNPQPAYAYPDSALGLFRSWLRENYIVTKFPKYMMGQAKNGNVPRWMAGQAVEAFLVNVIEKSEESRALKALPDKTD